MHRLPFVLLVLVVLAVAVSNANAEKRWKLGVKGGLSTAKFNGSSPSGWTRQPGLDVNGTVDGWREGFTAGAFGRYNFSGFTGLQVEVNYAQKGGEGPVSGTVDVEYPGNVMRTGEVDGVMTIELDYVEVPIFAVFSFPTDASEKVAITASAGGYVAYNLSAWTEISGRAEVQLPGGTADVRDFDQRWGLGSLMNRWDLGGLLGLGVEVALENVDLLFDFRWTFGFLSVDGTDNGDTILNNAISLTFGVGIPVGGAVE